MTERELTRRQFLRRGGVVAGSALLLAACGPALSPGNPPPAATSAPIAAPTAASAPTSVSAPTSAPAATTPPTPMASAPSASTVRFQSVVLPTYLPSAAGPAPDLPSTDPNVDPGFNNYPRNPPRATQVTPGKGGDVTFFVGAYYPRPRRWTRTLRGNRSTHNSA